MNWAESFTLGARRVGTGQPCFFIAEIGSNHDGSLDRAGDLVEAAAKAGADAAKFQLFSGDGLAARRIQSVDGRLEPNPVHPILDRLSVPLGWLPTLRERAERHGIVFLATPFDEERLAALAALGAEAIKIASGDLTHLPLLRQAAATGAALILGCGMSEEGDVESALMAIAESGGSKVAALQCVSLYPPDDSDLNLRAMASMARRFDIPVGLSDHSPGATAALGAVALGAAVVEKHFTLARSLPGPDHPFAMEPGEYAFMVREVRRLEAMLGDGVKRAVAREIPEQRVGRRSVLFSRNLTAGAVVSAGDLKCARPGGGWPPSRLGDAIGRRLARAVEADQPVSSDVFQL